MLVPQPRIGSFMEVLDCSGGVWVYTVIWPWLLVITGSFFRSIPSMNGINSVLVIGILGHNCIGLINVLVLFANRVTMLCAL